MKRLNLDLTDEDMAEIEKAMKLLKARSRVEAINRAVRAMNKILTSCTTGHQGKPVMLLV